MDKLSKEQKEEVIEKICKILEEIELPEREFFLGKMWTYRLIYKSTTFYEYLDQIADSKAEREATAKIQKAIHDLYDQYSNVDNCFWE
jgi:protein-arginine kinase